jgi:hypothetical protein
MNLGIKALNFALMWYASLAFISDFIETPEANTITLSTLLISGWAVIGCIAVCVIHYNKTAYRKLIL